MGPLPGAMVGAIIGVIIGVIIPIGTDHPAPREPPARRVEKMPPPSPPARVRVRVRVREDATPKPACQARTTWGAKAGEHDGRMWPRAGERDGRMWPRAGGSYQSHVAQGW